MDVTFICMILYPTITDILGYGGAILMVASIPFALSARKNKKQTMLYVQEEKYNNNPGNKNRRDCFSRY